MTTPSAPSATSWKLRSFRWDTSTTIPRCRILCTALFPSAVKPRRESPHTPVARKFSSFQVSIPSRAPQPAYRSMPLKSAPMASMPSMPKNAYCLPAALALSASRAVRTTTSQS